MHAPLCCVEYVISATARSGDDVGDDDSRASARVRAESLSLDSRRAGTFRHDRQLKLILVGGIFA